MSIEARHLYTVEPLIRKLESIKNCYLVQLVIPIKTNGENENRFRMEKTFAENINQKSGMMNEVFAFSSSYWKHSSR